MVEGDAPELRGDISLWRQGRGCAGKKGYRRRSKAKAAAKRLFPDEPHFGPYKCKFCGEYHNGHRNRRGST